MVAFFIFRDGKGVIEVFGGFWIDRIDCEAELERRRASGTLAEDIASLVQIFMRDGYVVIKNAVDVDYFTALAASNSVNLQILPQKGTLTPGQVVGWLSVSQGVDPRVPLTVVHRLTPYTLLQRLR